MVSKKDEEKQINNHADLRSGLRHLRGDEHSNKSVTNNREMQRLCVGSSPQWRRSVLRHKGSAVRGLTTQQQWLQMLQQVADGKVLYPCRTSNQKKEKKVV